MTLRPDHGTHICGIIDKLHLTKLTTLSGDPIQEFLTYVAAILNPIAFPMIKVRPAIHSTAINCRGQKLASMSERKHLHPQKSLA